MITRTHDRYLLRQFGKVLLISMVSFTIIYVTVDVFEELDNFIDHHARFKHIMLYYFYSLPFILTYISPISLLLATIFSMGIMARRNELTALLSSGVSLVRIALPILIASTLMSLAIIAFNETVVARANQERKDIKHYEIEGVKRSDPMVKENLHYLGEDGFVYLAARYDHRNKSLYDIVVQQFRHNTLVKRIDARMAYWNGKAWVFRKGFERTFAADSEVVRAFVTMTISEMREKPEDFAKKEVDQENMNYIELKNYIDKLRKSGANIEPYLVDLYFKFSFPLAGAIFVLLGVSLTSGKRKQSLATGFGMTLLISFIYYGILRTGRTLGQNGVIPPFLGAQLGNMAFLVVGGFLLYRANK